MIKIVFKNLDKSELAKEATKERLDAIIQKFPDLLDSRITMTLEMENSPLHAGPDLFTVALHILGGRYRDVRMEKSASNLYVALADISEHILETLNRFGDRSRVKQRAQARRVSGIEVVRAEPEVADDDAFTLTPYEQLMANDPSVSRGRKVC